MKKILSLVFIFGALFIGSSSVSALTVGGDKTTSGYLNEIMFDPAKGNPKLTPQIIPTTMVKSINYMEKSNRSTNDLLKYLYPKYTAEQLKGANATFQQTVSYAKSLGYKAEYKAGQLSLATIKSEINKGRPVIACLEGNNKFNWLEAQTTVIIYGYYDVKSGGQTYTGYQAKTLNHDFVDMSIANVNKLQFVESDPWNNTDPEQKNTYKWTGSIYKLTKGAV